MDFQQVEIKKEFNEQDFSVKIEYYEHQSESDQRMSELSNFLKLDSTATDGVAPLDHIKQDPEIMLESDEQLASENINDQTKSEKHVVKRTRPNFNPKRCYICKRNFKDVASLEIHLPVHTDMIPYVCEECSSESVHPIKLTSLGPLHRHFRLHARNFKCPKCPKWVRHVQRHVRIYHDPNDVNPQSDYMCKICGKISKSKVYFEKHQMFHKKPKEGRFVCSFCNKKCKSKTLLANHERCHTDERPFQCKYCPKAFKTKQNINSHERMHTGEKGFRCDVCSKSFRGKQALQRHMANIHRRSDGNGRNAAGHDFKEKMQISGELVESDISCQEREKEIEDQSINVKQELQVTPETDEDLPEQDSINNATLQLADQLKCYICEQVFNDCESRETHLSTHLDMLPYNCVECTSEGDPPLLFTSLSQFHQHLQLHAHNLKCPKCQFWTSTSELLAAHTTAMHTESVHNKTYTCPICGKQFTKRNFTRHMRIHKDLENRRFTCSFCGSPFGTKQSLVAHERNHTNEHPYQCKYCPKTVKTRSFLIAHERTHTGERPYPCQACDKTFGWLSSLQAHIEASHTDLLEQTGSAKIYKCKLEGCDFTTTKRAALGQHRAKHEMRHVCSFCKKHFHSKKAVSTHELIHLGIKDFHCELCPKSFRTKSALNMHVAMHNDIRPFVCKTCGIAYVQKIQLKNHLSRNVRCQNADQMEMIQLKSRETAANNQTQSDD